MSDSTISPLTVVLPVRNGMPFLTEAVESILKQSFADFQFLIVDDASTDGTPDYLRSLDDPRLCIITHKTSQGVARSLNHALRMASSPLIARQDADDISEPERFARQIAWLAAHPECVVLGTQVEKIDVAGNQLSHFSRPEAEAEIFAMLAAHNNPFTHGSVIMRREVVLAAGGYRAEIRCAEDYDLWLRLAQPGALANHPELLYRYRVHEGQICAKLFSDVAADCWFSRVLQAERQCCGEEDSLSVLDELQIAAIKQRKIWRPRGNWLRRVRVLWHYARLLESDSPRRAWLVRLQLPLGGWVR